MGSYSSSSTSSDSLNGLKFGQKIYFEDVGGAGGGGGNNSNKSGGSGSVSCSSAGDVAPASPAKKGRFAAAGGQQPPRCQVEGCKVDLSDAKGYYARHKVCVMHSKSSKVVVSGNEQRFCQQCSRSVCLALFLTAPAFFHPLVSLIVYVSCFFFSSLISRLLGFNYFYYN